MILANKQVGYSVSRDYYTFNFLTIGSFERHDRSGGLLTLISAFFFLKKIRKDFGIHGTHKREK